MYVYIIFVILLIYAIYKERQALGCPDIHNGRDCDNANGKAVKGTTCDVTMSKEDIIKTIKKGVHYENKWVKWRYYFMLSVMSSILIFYILKSTSKGGNPIGILPSEIELTVSVLVMMFLLISTDNFYKFHLRDHVSNNIEHGVDILANQYTK